MFLRFTLWSNSEDVVIDVVIIETENTIYTLSKQEDTMSISYWMIEGVGINTDRIEPFLDKKKLTQLLLEQFPDNEDLLEISDNNKYDELDVQDFLYGNLFENLGDLLTHCDDTDSITYGDDGESGSYFYYPPSMPWHRTATEPTTLEDVHRRIIKAVQVVTNLSTSDIEMMIDDDLYVVGAG